MDEHVGWRQNYQPQDLPVITPYDKTSQSFQDTANHMRSVFNELSSKLRTESLPWHTAGRFWGHMNSETLMPAIIAYTAAMLWNGNNVAYESSPGTSQMEEGVGHHLCKMMSYREGIKAGDTSVSTVPLRTETAPLNTQKTRQIGSCFLRVADHMELPKRRLPEKYA